LKALKYQFTQPDGPEARLLIAELSRRLQDLTGDDGRSSFAGEAFDPAKDAFLVVCLGDTPVACGAIVGVDERVCEIKRMYARLPGLGTKVLHLLEAKAYEVGYARLRLSTRRVNTRAVRFYQKNGFKEIRPYGKYIGVGASICLGKQVQTVKISTIDTLTTITDGLIELLVDSVASGASVGFLPPLETATAADYWRSVAAELEAGTKKLLVALEAETLIGAVQLAVSEKQNGRHRGEVQKLMVHTGFRGRGIGKKLMWAVEAAAIELGRQLLVLDTRKGDAASLLYEKMGYLLAGEIPGYARSASGELHATSFFYKQLTAAAPSPSTGNPLALP
jgi:ribosomal protein S18 acetylase RimI-like enzyme